MTARMSNTVNTVAATNTLTNRGTIQMPACTQIREQTTTTLMQSSTVVQSEAITMRMKMMRMWGTGQTVEVRLAVRSLEPAVLALTGAACVQTEGTYFNIYTDAIHMYYRSAFLMCHLPIKT